MKRRLIYSSLFLILLGAICYGYYYLRPRAVASVEPDPVEFPIRGIDVSIHNGVIDFDKVKADGYSFVFLKASEGTDFKDRNFISNLHNAKKAGLKTGVYHFFRFDTDGQMQALNLLNSVRYQPIDFPLVIDIEEWGNPDVTTTRDIIENLRRMINYLENNNFNIMLYSNKDGYNRFIKGNFDNYPLWIGSFTTPEPEIDWSIWQYTHSGSVDGVKGNVDINTIKTDYFRLFQ